MQIRGLRHIVLGAVFCLGVVGCSHNAKHDGKHSGNGASTQGAGEGSNFVGSEEQRDMLAKRKIYFDYDQAALRENEMNIIYAHAEYLKQNPNRRVRLEGHTDEQGSREYNVSLGERRARAVADAMMSQGVTRDQIAIVSFGKEKPDATGHSDESHSLNRRAVIVYEEM